MIAVECPQCGAPTPAFPLTPDRVTCRACKYVGPPKPAVLEQLRASAYHVGAANAQHARQLGAAQLAARMSLIKNRTRLHIVLVLLLLPGLLFLAVLVASIVGDDPYYTVTIWTGAPLLVFALSIFIGSRALDRQVRELTEACGAVPPASEGGAAQCHLCGADLPPATSASPICRCRHCGADNVASPALMRELMEKRGWMVGGFERRLAARGAYLAKRGASAVTIVIALAFASPFVGCVGGFALQIALDEVELDRVPADYVMVAFDDEVCAALVTAKYEDGSWKLFGGFEEGATFQIVKEPGRFTRVNERWFLGRHMKSKPHEETRKGQVTSVFVNLLRPKRNQLRIDMPPPSYDFVSPIEGKCLVDPPKDVVPCPWPRSAPEPPPSASGPASSAVPAAPSDPAPAGSPSGAPGPKKGRR